MFGNRVDVLKDVLEGDVWIYPAKELDPPGLLFGGFSGWFVGRILAGRDLLGDEDDVLSSARKVDFLDELRVDDTA